MSNIGCNCVSARKNCRHAALNGGDGMGWERSIISTAQNSPFLFPTKRSERGNNRTDPVHAYVLRYPRPIRWPDFNFKHSILNLSTTARCIHQAEHTRAKIEIGSSANEKWNPLSILWLTFRRDRGRESERGSEEIKGSLSGMERRG